MLRAHCEPPVALDGLLARTGGASLVSFDVGEAELDKFLAYFEETANSAQDLVAMDRLGQAFSRITDGLRDKHDRAAHLLRPGAAALGYSTKQGQYLAFIHCYVQLHRRAPAESEIQAYFRVSPPSVHEMLKTLKRRGWIDRQPGEPRSIRLLVRADQIPALE